MVFVRICTGIQNDFYKLLTYFQEIKKWRLLWNKITSSPVQNKNVMNQLHMRLTAFCSWIMLSLNAILRLSNYQIRDFSYTFLKSKAHLLSECSAVLMQSSIMFSIDRLVDCRPNHRISADIIQNYLFGKKSKIWKDSTGHSLFSSGMP